MIELPSLSEIEAAAALVHREFQATAQYRWDLLSQQLGASCWLKHENHTPVGAFKIRGGLLYFERLRRENRLPREIISATRGNHGQSLAWAARSHGVRCCVVVPLGNSVEKNAAMRALGAELIEFGEDFQASREHATELARQRGAHMVPSFHADLLCGVATYWLEFLRAVPTLQRVYVPVGLGSGICAAVAAKLALGHGARIVGVISDQARTYAQSLAAGRVVPAAVSTRLADGMAVRVADEEALSIIAAHVDHLVEVSDADIAQAMRDIFRATHNVCEGAGAAAFAAACQEREQFAGQEIGIVITGGNVDSEVFAQVLSGR